MNRARYQDLQAQLDEIERQQEDKTLPHSDQQMLDQAWDDIMRQIEELRPGTPIPEEPVRIAPPPPKSVTLQTGISRSGKLMTKLPDGRWVEAPPLPSAAPPADTARICNCDSDGECGYCEEERLAEEEQERINAWVDDREGCERCHGCHYCQDPRYDGSDEI